MSVRWVALVAVAGMVLTGCGERGITDPIDDPRLQPQNLKAVYEWALEGWVGAQPVGQPTALLTWAVPTDWRNEPFRVYGRRSAQRDYLLIATVTSCADGFCRYADANVSGGQSYDYFVALVDERTGRETASASAVQVSVPSFAAPAVPVPQEARSYNNALLVRWQPGGPTTNLWKYKIFLVAIDGQATDLYQVGETDGTGFLDLRVENGHSYTYRIAAVDVQGHPSTMSAPVTGTPRATSPSFSIASSSAAGTTVFGPGEPIQGVGTSSSGREIRLDTQGRYTRSIPW